MEHIISRPASSRPSLAPVSLVSLFFKSGGLWALIAMVILIALTLFSWTADTTAKQFAAQGVKVPATITKRWTKVTHDSDGDRKTSYYVMLDYNVGGQNFSVTEKVSRTTYRAKRLRQTVAILYLPSQPKKIEYPIGNNAKSAITLQLIALIVGFAWLYMLWLFGRWAVFATHARKHGRQLYATVLKIERTSVKINDNHRYKLVWTDELRRIGKSYMAKESAFDGYSKGDEIIVFEYKDDVFWRGDIGDRAPRLSPIPRVKRFKR